MSRILGTQNTRRFALLLMLAIRRHVSDVVRFSKDPAIFVKADRLFDEVSRELRSMLPTADVQHVGSTAIPGSLTKGDLDIVVRVPKESFAQTDYALAARFERNTASDRSDAFSAFMDESTDPELGIQLVAIGGASDNFLVWRDLLRSDSEIRRQYDELKAQFNGRSMDEYREAKSAFIEKQLTF